ncbi:MAG: heavy metal-associated domain-containing protein [Acidaminococcaceae bacterium]
MKKIILRIEGMSCQGCVAGAKMALEEVLGVNQVEVSLEEKNAKVWYDETIVQVVDLTEAVAAAGFSASK